MFVDLLREKVTAVFAKFKKEISMAETHPRERERE
jgi:hypothetical protein